MRTWRLGLGCEPGDGNVPALSGQNRIRPLFGGRQRLGRGPYSAVGRGTVDMKDGLSIRDFRGALVWWGIVFGLGGFLANEWPTPFRMGPMMFFGGWFMGIGVMRNLCKRQHGEPPKVMQTEDASHRG